MSSNRQPVGPELRQGLVRVQQLRSGRSGKMKVRVTVNDGEGGTTSGKTSVVIDRDQLFDLAELLDELCDTIEDEQEDRW